jgi:uncharacterized membrane protein
MSGPAVRWVSKRNCSASPRQLAFVFASIVLVSFLFGSAFAALGLWLVLPFVGLELLAVALAFFCYGRHAADFERIEIDAGQVRIERHAAGQVEQALFAAPWTRIELDAAGRGWMRRMRLFIVARGERFEVGQHLSDQRRLHLARELKQALRVAALPG